MADIIKNLQSVADLEFGHKSASLFFCGRIGNCLPIMRKWTPEKISEIQKLKIKWLTDTEIAERFGETLRNIRNIVQRYKLALPPRLRNALRSQRLQSRWKTERQEFLEILQRPRFWTPERKEKLKELMEKGIHTYRNIAEILGCSRDAAKSAATVFGFCQPKTLLSIVSRRANNERWAKFYSDIYDTIEDKLLSEEMGYIIAVASTWGNYYPQGIITICSKDIQLLKFFSKTYAKVTGKKLKIITSHPTSIMLKIQNKAITDIISWRNKIRTTHFFHTRSLDFRRGFIKGLFDIRGRVCPDKLLWQIRLILPRGEYLVRHIVKKCLSLFGIKSKRHGRIGGESASTLTISGDDESYENFFKFKEEIGSRHGEKNKALKRLIEKYKRQK